MANTLHARAIISAVDRTGGPLGRIAARLRAFGARSGVTAVSSQMREVGTALGRVGREAQRSFRFVRRGALLAAGAIAGAAGIVRSYTKELDEQAKTARQLGITTQFMRRLNFASEITGASIDQLKAGIDRMVRTAGSGDLVKNIEKIDPQLARILHGTKSAETGFDAIIRRLGEIPEVSKRNALAFAAFGRSGAEAMTRLSQGGIEELRKLFAEADRRRGIVSKDDVQEAEEFNDTLSRLKHTLFGLRDAIGARLVRAIRKMIERFDAWLLKNRELIASKIEEWITKLIAALEKLAEMLPAIIEEIRSIATGLDQVVRATVGWEIAIGALVGLVNAGLILAIVQLGKEIVKLGVLLAATPIGGFAAILAGAAYVIWRSWEKSGAGVKQSLRGLWGMFSGFSDWMAGVFTLDFARSADGFQRLFTGIYDTVAGIVKAIAGVIDHYFGTEIVAAINRGVEAWKRLIQGFWNSIRNSAFGRFLGLADSIESEGDDAASKAENSGSKVSLGFAAGIRSRLSEVTAAAQEMANAVSNYLPQSPARMGPLRELAASGRKTAELYKGGMQSAVSRVRTQALELAKASLPPGVSAPTLAGARAGRSLGGGTTVNVYLQSPQFNLQGEGREAAEHFWRELERVRLSHMGDVGII